jgi:hypothetical protein
MEEDPEQQRAYKFTGPDERGLIWLEMPNLDPKHGGQFYCVTLGDDKDAIAEAMCQWPGAIDYGECQ